MILIYKFKRLLCLLWGFILIELKLLLEYLNDWFIFRGRRRDYMNTDLIRTFEFLLNIWKMISDLDALKLLVKRLKTHLLKLFKKIKMTVKNSAKC